LWLQIVLTVLYAAWLIILKPMTKTVPSLLQAGLSQFIGIVALFSVAEYVTLPGVVALAFGIGFAGARHTLMMHEEKQFTLLALVWGMLVCQLVFVAYHWVVIYGIGAIKIPEIAIVISVLGFLAERYYTSFRRNDGRIKQDDVVVPTLFAAALLLILLIFFSGVFTFLG